MTTRKIALSALGAALVLSTAATASFAAPGKGHKDRMPIRQEAAFVHLLKVADANKDGKISKEEFAARQDALFTEIDKDKDGSITPKEMREMLNNFGDTEEVQIQYNTYCGSRNLSGRDKYVTEHLYLVRKHR